MHLELELTGASLFLPASFRKETVRKLIEIIISLWDFKRSKNREMNVYEMNEGLVT